MVAIARTLSSVAGPRDVVGRLGGDEFVVLLPGSDLNSGMRLRDEILAGLRDSGDGVAASIGIVITDRGETLGQVMSRADHHMFQQKRQSRTAIGQATGERIAVSVHA